MRIRFLIIALLALTSCAQGLDRDSFAAIGSGAVLASDPGIAPGDLVLDGVRMPGERRGDSPDYTYVNLHLKTSEREETAGDIVILYTDSLQVRVGADGAVREVTRRPMATASVKPGTRTAGAPNQRMVSINFRDAPINQLTQFYSQLMGVEVSVGEDCKKATVTMRGQNVLTQDQVDVFIRAALKNQGITFEPAGEGKLKLVCGSP